MDPYCNLLIILSIICLYSIEAHNGGFSVELIHRDSPNSPLYDPNETPFQRLINAIHRSFNRVNGLKPTENPYPREEMYNVNGDFIMKYAIGSNNLMLVGLLEIISNMIWLQCQNCFNCYKPDLPIFDPSKSTTYENVSCDSGTCGLVPEQTCIENVCQYEMNYISGATSSGDVALDTFSLTTNEPNIFISFPKVIFGCGHVNIGFSSSFSGIIGIGPGPLSFATQLRNSLHNKFSYCLVLAYVSNNISLLNFGERAVVSGPGAVSTPLYYGPNGDLYYLNLEGISVGGGQRIKLKAEAELADTNQANMIIDFATTLTSLPQGLYDALESELISRINSNRVPSPVSSLKLCYNSPLNSIEIPILTAHFNGGANVVLNRDNTFVSVKDDIVGFAIVPSSNNFVYGNLAMRNYLIGIDREKNVVSFMPTDCTKH